MKYIPLCYAADAKVHIPQILFDSLHVANLNTEKVLFHGAPHNMMWLAGNLCDQHIGRTFQQSDS
tara:strand:+ start:26018 stop:26212 length:195 start_codon:yes stop_codon:yes gene_type:complete